MALSIPQYTTLFHRIGQIVKQTNLALSIQAPTLIDPSTGGGNLIANQFTADKILVEGLQNDFESFAQSAAGWIDSLNRYTDNTLADLQLDLNAPSSDSSTILDYLYDDMISAGVYLEVPNVLTTSSSFVGYGDGEILITNLNERGEYDERPIDEMLAIRCIADKHTGATSGTETFQIYGYPLQQASSYKTQGNGASGPTITTTQAGSVLANGDFEAWTDNNPDDWDITGGSDPDNLIEPDDVDVYRGTYSAKLVSGTSDVTLSQDMSSVLSVDTVYAASFNIKSTANAGTFSGYISGTGMADIVLYSGAASAIPATWTVATAFFVLPKDPATDLTLVIEWDGAGAATGNVWIDNMGLAVPTDFGHVKYILHAGANDFIRDDVFMVETDTTGGSDGSGLFQTYFGRFYDKMLPTVSTNPTLDNLLIPDSWAL